MYTYTGYNIYMVQSPYFYSPCWFPFVPFLCPLYLLGTLLAVTGSVHLVLRLLVNWPPLSQPFPFPPHSKFPVPRLNICALLRRLQESSFSCPEHCELISYSELMASVLFVGLLWSGESDMWVGTEHTVRPAADLCTVLIIWLVDSCHLHIPRPRLTAGKKQSYSNSATSRLRKYSIYLSTDRKFGSYVKYIISYQTIPYLNLNSVICLFDGGLIYMKTCLT
jgi:hypothetical protein